MSPIWPKRPRLRLEPEEYRHLCREVLARDNFRCQNCGSQRNLQVHHQEFRSHSGDDVEANLITLCTTCHERVHHKGSLDRLNRRIRSDVDTFMRSPPGPQRAILPGSSVADLGRGSRPLHCCAAAASVTCQTRPASTRGVIGKPRSESPQQDNCFRIDFLDKYAYRSNPQDWTRSISSEIRTGSGVCSSTCVQSTMSTELSAMGIALASHLRDNAGGGAYGYGTVFKLTP